MNINITFKEILDHNDTRHEESTVPRIHSSYIMLKESLHIIPLSSFFIETGLAYSPSHNVIIPRRTNNRNFKPNSMIMLSHLFLQYFHNLCWKSYDLTRGIIGKPPLIRKGNP